jgi:hypothetical protein
MSLQVRFAVLIDILFWNAFAPGPSIGINWALRCFMWVD